MLNAVEFLSLDSNTQIEMIDNCEIPYKYVIQCRPYGEGKFCDTAVYDINSFDDLDEAEDHYEYLCNCCDTCLEYRVVYRIGKYNCIFVNELFVVDFQF